MKLDATTLRAQVLSATSIEGLRALQERITAQAPSESGLNFAEANEILKLAGDRISELARKQRDFFPAADLTRYDARELYDLLDNMSEYKRVHGRGSSADAAQARAYVDAQRKRIKAECKRRGIAGTRADDGRVYGSGKQAWQKGQGA